MISGFNLKLENVRTLVLNHFRIKTSKNSNLILLFGNINLFFQTDELIHDKRLSVRERDMKFLLETVTCIAIKERLTCIITIETVMCIMHCRKSHLHNCNSNYHLHNYNKNCHPNICCRNCHLHMCCRNF